MFSKLSCTHSYLLTIANGSLPWVLRSHRCVLDNLCRPELALRLCTLASNEMTQKQEIVQEWQSAAATVIVALGSVYGQIVLDDLLSRFEAGKVPHYYVVKTLGDFAVTNGMSMETFECHHFNFADVHCYVVNGSQAKEMILTSLFLPRELSLGFFIAV